MLESARDNGYTVQQTVSKRQLRLAPHAPSLGMHVFVLLSVLETAVCILQIHSREAAAYKGHAPLPIHDHCQPAVGPHCLLQCICLPGNALPGIHSGGNCIWRTLEPHGNPYIRVLWLAPLCFQLYLHPGEPPAVGLRAFD